MGCVFRKMHNRKRSPAIAVLYPLEERLSAIVSTSTGRPGQCFIISYFILDKVPKYHRQNIFESMIITIMNTMTFKTISKEDTRVKPD